MQQPIASAGPKPAGAPVQGRHAFQDPLAALSFASRWRQTRRWVYVACDVVHALFAVLLWQTGYPAGRVLLYVTVLLLAVGLHLVVETPRARAREDQGDGRLRDRSELIWLGTMLVEIAVTGGVRSPLFPSNLAAIPINLMQFGRSRTAKIATAAILGCAAAFLLVPDAWTGPHVSVTVYGITLAGAVIATGGTSVYYWAVLKRLAAESIQESLRAREQLALQAAARARELEQLVSKISHELKNPLTAIKTLVQVSVRATDDPMSRTRLEVVEREVGRIQETLQDYLTLSRPLDHLTPEALTLGSVVDDLLSTITIRADESGVRLERQGDATVTADRRRISEALLNLLVNALEASQAGGVIRVEIAERDGQVQVSVSDRGRGMPSSVLAQLGTPFFTTRHSGTGLGVTLARAAFAQHGGRLEYASTPGEGTTATGTLPLSPPRSPDGASPDRR